MKSTLTIPEGKTCDLCPVYIESDSGICPIYREDLEYFQDEDDNSVALRCPRCTQKRQLKITHIGLEG